jgi:large subunit ribosomal protein L31e
MAELTRTYIIPLRKAWLKTQRYKRAPKAARTVAAFITRHMKSEDVRITPELNHALWQHGIKNPPHKIKVDTKKDDKGVCIVTLHGMPFPVKKEAKKEGGGLMDKVKGMAGVKDSKPKAETKKEEKPVEAQVVKSEKKEAPKTESKPAQPKPVQPAAPKPEPKKEEPKKDASPLRLNK